jgi:hypothetical protein
MTFLAFLVGLVFGAIGGGIGAWYYLAKKNAATVTLKAP